MGVKRPAISRKWGYNDSLKDISQESIGCPKPKTRGFRVELMESSGEKLFFVVWKIWCVVNALWKPPHLKSFQYTDPPPHRRCSIHSKSASYFFVLQKQKTGQLRPFCSWQAWFLLQRSTALSVRCMWFRAEFLLFGISKASFMAHTSLSFRWLSSNCRASRAATAEGKVTNSRRERVWSQAVVPRVWIKAQKHWLTFLTSALLKKMPDRVCWTGFRAGAVHFSHPASLSSRSLITKGFRDALGKCHFTPAAWTGFSGPSLNTKGVLHSLPEPH